MTTIDMSGVRKLAASLERPRVGRFAFAAVRGTAAKVERSMKEAAPVDTGALRDSIGTDMYGGTFSRHMVAVVGPTVPYGPFVEFGHADQPPQPYAGPALDQHAASYVAAMERAAEIAARQALT